ncbi:alpha/beta-hydrolase [Meira miltonrushii]|uniref:Alpha/beta-hydrolase n=1 Tax=Meira miltonrushii TaxID=1280837 RepID=A0A316V502_9BASI|nr:alpha/beta-hydrolase [Meira miltonrushii]PWN32649.1 alpha/beta-hydrolase [Meira miltonrushii]
MFSKDPKALLPQGIEPSAGCTKCTSSITFKSKQAKQFQVGTSIPTLSFKTKQSWAGSIAIPDTPTAKGASLFFWLWGKDAVQSGNDLVIWMNGGPGCNSLVGMTTENGPFIFNTNKAQPNPYSWTTAANMLYIAQPIGASFTTGKASNSNELQISEQFTLFLIEFFKVFPELSRFNIWLTGESYMGNMAPYQWNAIKQNPQSKNLAMKGGMLVSPLFSSIFTQVEVPVSTFAKENQKILDINDRGLAKIAAESKKCKFATFLDTYLAYPPKGKIPDPSTQSVKAESDKCNLTNFIPTYLKYPAQGRLPVASPNCDPFDLYQDTAKKLNPMFDYYNIDRNKEVADGQQTEAEKFLNDVNVQNYIHAPNQQFKMCKDVFSGGNLDLSDAGDSTPSYSNSLFAQMIEFCGKFVIMAGALDGLVIKEGVQLALQNLTWNGGQGFRAPPSIPMYDLEGQQKAIATIEERGLRLIIVSDSGHMVPRDSPSFSLNAIFSLVGHSSGTCHK